MPPRDPERLQEPSEPSPSEEPARQEIGDPHLVWMRDWIPEQEIVEVFDVVDRAKWPILDRMDLPHPGSDGSEPPWIA